MASAIASSSTAPSTSSSNSPSEEPRPQAGPLPSKRGEIGYQEEIHGNTQGEASTSPSQSVSLPERHPADRDQPPAANAPTTSVPSSATPSSSTPANSTTTPSSDDSSSTNSIKKAKKHCVLKLFHPKTTAKYGGIKLTSILAFSLQLSVAVATIAGWIVAALMLNGKGGGGSQQTDSNGNAVAQSSISASIFIHVVFAIAFLGQLLFLERRIFIMRAQRYAYLHPGEILPTARRRGLGATTGIGIAPWNRPPLPTYARALQESGIGTGDVEDNEIAIVPPPAYGNTRGSRLLLTGFLRESLRAQRPASMHTVASSRPVSYASRDDDWEIIQDADRARQLEETLTTLEGPVRERT